MSFTLPSEVVQQLFFLIAEVRSQLQNLDALFKQPSNAISRSILERSGHSYNLKQRTQIRCLKAFSEGDPSVDGQSLQAASDIADELDRIAALCRDCTQELETLRDYNLLKQQHYRKQLTRVDSSLELLESMLYSGNALIALETGKAHIALTRFYQRIRKLHLRSIKKHPHTESLISSLFIARSIVAMGTCLINISESLMSGMLGQPMNMKQLLSMQAMSSSIGHEAWDTLSFQSMAETRSGSSITAIAKDNSRRIGVLKEGNLIKVQNELRGLERWNQLIPGITPKVISQHQEGSSAALILEHLPGQTLEALCSQHNTETLQHAFAALESLLPEIWTKTKRQAKIAPAYIEQLRKRLPTIQKIHPSLISQGEVTLDQQKINLENLLDKAEKLEHRYPAPFSIFIHGDFNLDNILFAAETQRIYFIDLNRSRNMDYVQDISVFIVSGLRLQHISPEQKDNLVTLMVHFFSMAQRFADANKDKHFDRRMALGLARSLITSVRFIYDKSAAATLFDIGVYLLNHATSASKKKKYHLPLKEILNG